MNSVVVIYQLTESMFALEITAESLIALGFTPLFRQRINKYESVILREVSRMIRRDDPTQL